MTSQVEKIESVGMISRFRLKFNMPSETKLDSHDPKRDKKW